MPGNGSSINWPTRVTCAMSSNWLFLLAAGLELGGVSNLLVATPGSAQLLAYLVAHAMACALLSMVLLPFLPERYRGQPLTSAAFLFTLQFAVPFIGSVGVVVGILLALYLPRTDRELPWQEIRIPELPFTPVDMSQQVVYSQGGLQQVLREASDPDKRLKALMATRQMNERDAIAILRDALRDKVDDVRLLAYSMLEQKEKTLAQRASQLQLALANASDTDAVSVQRRLAQVWWEMAYLGLAQGGLRGYYLNSARGMLSDLTRRRAQHGDWRLLGRVELALGHLPEAEQAFRQGLASGAPEALIMPYLAELAFLRRDFEGVRAALSRCPADQLHPSILPLIEAWL